MGVYIAEKPNGTNVYISYTPRGESRVRQAVEFVENGPAFGKRLAAAKRRAKGELNVRKGQLALGRHKRPKRGRVPAFAGYVEEFYTPLLRRSDMKPKPREAEIRRVTTGTIGRFFNSLRLDEITRSKVEAFVDARLRNGAHAAGVNRDFARLRHLLNDAIDREEFEGRLPRIAWRKLMMEEDPQSWRPMRDDEKRRLLGAFADPTVRAYVEFLLHTGIRPQAGLQLRWEHVDLRRMVVTVSREIHRTRAYPVYLNSRVQEILRSLYAMRPEALRQPGVTVFCHRNGKPRRSIRTAWEGACKDAKIEGLHVRGLRATAATRLQEGGANEFDVKLHLGHSVKSMGITGRYIDPHEEHRRRIAELTIRHRPTNIVELRPREGRVGSTSEALSGTLSG